MKSISYKYKNGQLYRADTLKIVSEHIRHSIKSIVKNVYLNDRFFSYRSVKIPKKNGEYRILNPVIGPLKTIQKKTYNYLEKNYKPTKYAYGFVKERGIIKNAMVHRNSKLIIKLDIKDFFPSITFPRVLGMFKAYPFNFAPEIATLYTQICCMEYESKLTKYNNKNKSNGVGSIAQGAVTSPYISNMICRKLDKKIANLGIKERFRFTRYADDITLSTNANINSKKIISEISQIIEDEGFEINENKTRIMTKRDRQIVTGIVVNRGLNVNKKYYKEVRAILHNCINFKKGVYDNLTKQKYLDYKKKYKENDQPKNKYSIKCFNLKIDNKNKITFIENNEVVINHNSILMEFKNSNNGKIYQRIFTVPKFPFKDLGSKEVVKDKNHYIKYIEKWEKKNNNAIVTNAKCVDKPDKILIELFLFYLKGRIDFIGQVSIANKNILPKEAYDIRMNKYEKLKNLFQKVRDNEEVVFAHNVIKQKSRKIYRNTVNEKIIEIDNATTKDNLELFVNREKTTDYRFFLNKNKLLQSEDLDSMKKEIKDIIVWPKFNINCFYKLLSQSRSSEDPLGTILHQNDTITKKNFDEFLETVNKNFYELNYSIRPLIQEFKDKIKHHVLKNGDFNNEGILVPRENMSLFWKNESFSNDVLLKFKKDTRIQNMNQATNLDEFIKRVKEANKNIHVDVKFDGLERFYAPVNLMIKNLSTIIRSMHDHDEKEVKIILTKLKSKGEFESFKDKIIISVYGNNTNYIQGFKRDFVGGDTTSVISKFAGVANYYILTKTRQKKDGVLHNMFKESLQDPKDIGLNLDSTNKYGAFTHIITFPNVSI